MCIEASQAAGVREGTYDLRQGTSGYTYTTQVCICANLFPAAMTRMKVKAKWVCSQHVFISLGSGDWEVQNQGASQFRFW